MRMKTKMMIEIEEIKMKILEKKLLLFGVH
jgi:hypothetical protein